MGRSNGGEMFDRFLSYLGRLPAGGGQQAPTGDNARVAAAALLIGVMDADGKRMPQEMNELRVALGSAFGISGPELDRLVTAGSEAERSAVDFYGFTSILMRELDEDARRTFIEHLWSVVYADGERHEMEDSVVWRIAELLGVDAAERNAIRRRVVAAIESPSKDPQ